MCHCNSISQNCCSFLCEELSELAKMTKCTCKKWEVLNLSSRGRHETSANASHAANDTFESHRQCEGVQVQIRCTHALQNMNNKIYKIIITTLVVTVISALLNIRQPAQCINFKPLKLGCTFLAKITFPVYNNSTFAVNVTVAWCLTGHVLI